MEEVEEHWNILKFGYLANFIYRHTFLSLNLIWLLKDAQLIWHDRLKQLNLILFEWNDV